jgi:hypothetical protein
VEGRFFLQDKLCALGLAEVKTVAGYLNQFTEVGQQTSLKSANRKSANSRSHSAIPNPQISKVCESANTQFF